MRRNMVSILLALMLCLGATAPAQAASSTFVDVPKNHWAHDYIQTAADNGWIQGVGNGLFLPEESLNCVSFVVLCGRAFLYDEVGKIAVLGNANNWWEPYCSAAALNGILEATPLGDSYFNNGYKWDENILYAEISRYDMAQMALNIMSKNGFTVTEQEKRDAESKINDWSSIPVEYRDAVSSCVAMQIINGYSDGTFSGAASVSRAQSAVILVRLNSAIGKGAAVTPTPETTPAPSGGCAPADVNEDGVLTEEEVYDALMTFKLEVPAETPWGSDKYYQSPIGGRTYGCAAFAYQASDKAFGNLPERVVSDINNLRVGDYIHFKNATHWYIVTKLGDNTYYGASGNTNGEVSWTDYGEYSLLEQLVSEGQAIIYTRYPV